VTAAARAATGERAFALRPPPRGARLRTFAVLAVVLVPVTVVLLMAGDRRALPVVLVPWALTFGIMEFFVRRAARGRVVLDDTGLRLEAPLATDVIRWSSMRAGEARVVDLAREPELAPHRRQVGLGLAGYHSGMFRLRDGSGALVAVADGAPAVLVPWGRQSRLLVTPEDPEAFLAELRARAG
jgi:hypothetical protein